MRNELEIVNDLVEAKATEKAAEARRIELERELIEKVGARPEGAKTHTIGDFKVVITGKLKRKIDWDLFDQSIAAKIPESMQPVKIKRELDVTGVKFLENNEPQIYKLLIPALTIEPAKTEVSITRGA